MVEPEYSVSGPRGSDRPLIQRTDSRRDGYGVQPHATRSARQPRQQDHDGLMLHRYLRIEPTKGTVKAPRRDTMSIRDNAPKKTPGPTLDKKNSFREGNLISPDTIDRSGERLACQGGGRCFFGLGRKSTFHPQRWHFRVSRRHWGWFRGPTGPEISPRGAEGARRGRCGRHWPRFRRSPKTSPCPRTSLPAARLKGPDGPSEMMSASWTQASLEGGARGAEDPQRPL
jgi:hypothetical protein